MRILLFPSINIIDRRISPYLPYGLLSLQAVAVRCGNACVDIHIPPIDLLQRTFESSAELVEGILNTVDLSKYDVFGLSTICSSFYHSLGIAKRLKQVSPQSVLFMGGPYVTKMFNRLLDEFEFVDGIFVGESEDSFSKFISRPLDYSNPFAGIEGIYSRENTFVQGLVADNLDTLPRVVLDTDYIKWLSLVRTNADSDELPSIEASRGCPLQCSFCSTRQVWGSSVRRKSAQRLVSEMQEIHSITGDTFFSFIGDNLGAPLYPFMNFCKEMIALRSEYTWSCSLKLDCINYQHLEMMWDAGCRAMFIGVESASQETLNKVNKAARVDKEIEAIKTAILMGFLVQTSFIIGFPWETKSDIQLTYDLHCELLDLGAHKSQIGILCPIPGTEIVSGYQISFDQHRSFISQDDIPPDKECQELVERLPDLFSNLGYYPTSNVSRTEIRAYRNAAAQARQLHMRQRNMLTLNKNASKKADRSLIKVKPTDSKRVVTLD